MINSPSLVGSLIFSIIMSVSHKVFCAYISFNISKLILSRSTLKWNCLLLIMLKTPSFSKVVRLLLEECQNIS